MMPPTSISACQLLPHEKDTAIACFEERCRYAESRLLEAEMRLSKVMVQIYRDSPKLATSLLLSTGNAAAKGTKSGDVPKFQTFLESVQTSEGSRETEDPTGKLPASIKDKQSRLPVYDLSQKTDDKLSKPPDSPFSQLTTDTKGSGNLNMPTTDTAQYENNSGISAHTFGSCQPMLEKLTIELWKTKKQLFTALQERESTKGNIQLLDVKEYEEIINELQQDLLLLRCQYTEIRQSLQSEQPDHIVHTIGKLQDQVRKQENIIRRQQSVIQTLSLKCREYSQGVTGVTRNVQGKQVSKPGEASPGQHHLLEQTDGQLGVKGSHPAALTTASSDQTGKHQSELTTQLKDANEQVKSLKEELEKERKTMNSLRSKCQMLGEQHEQTVATLERLDKLKSSHVQILDQKARAELIWVRQQLRMVVNTTEAVMKQNEQLKQISERHRIDTDEMRELHREKITKLEQSKAVSERNFQLLLEKYQANQREFQAIRELFVKRRGTDTGKTCAQEVAQPPGIHRGLAEYELHVDGDKSLDCEDSEVFGEGGTETKYREHKQSCTEKTAGEQQRFCEETRATQHVTDEGALSIRAMFPGQQKEKSQHKEVKVGKDEQLTPEHGRVLPRSNSSDSDEGK